MDTFLQVYLLTYWKGLLFILISSHIYKLGCFVFVWMHVYFSLLLQLLQVFYFNHQKDLTNVKLISQVYVTLVFFTQQRANRSKMMSNMLWKLRLVADSLFFLFNHIVKTQNSQIQHQISSNVHRLTHTWKYVKFFASKINIK